MQEGTGAEARHTPSPRFRPAEKPDGTAQEERERLLELERERDAMEVFARVAAHELLAPLVVAETQARLLDDQLRERVDRAPLGELYGLIRVLSRTRMLVETLLREARSEGKPLQRGEVNLQRLVDDAVALLHIEIRAHEARVVATDLPVVQGDEELLGAVINNLLLNALRYGPRTGGEVRFEASREAAHWRISVTSQGPTIPTEDRARIFEPYNRGTRERRARGAGLGLTICRSIVERHDGRIGVSSHPREGNCFYFTLPASGRASDSAAGNASS